MKKYRTCTKTFAVNVILKKIGFTLLCLLPLFFITLSAKAGINDKKITITFNAGEKLDQALKKLEQASGVTMAYDPKATAAITVKAKSFTDAELTDILKFLLTDTGLSFKNESGSILIYTPPNVQAGGGPGTLKGRVVEFETSEPLPGATVRVIELSGKGGATDLKGYYTITGIPAGKYHIQVSFIGFTSTTLEVEVNAGKEATYDVKLSGSNGLKEVVISGTKQTRAPVAHTTEKQVVEEIRQAQSVVSGISSEQISKSADRNAAEVIQRVSGVSTVDDKFVVVRGLNPRYNLTYLNDNVAPSTEVDSRSFALDLIPARIIDKILIYKSTSPENQGDATGGVIKIYTKDAKNIKHFDIEVQAGDRPGTTFNPNFLTYQGGKTDWLGFDDGTRKLPSTVPGYGVLDQAKISQKTYVSSFSPILTYEEKKALPNLQLTANYYNSFKLFDKTLSVLSSLSYKNERLHQDVDRQQGIGQDPQSNDAVYHDNNNTETAQFNLLQNFSLRLRDSSNIQFKNFLLQQGQSSTTVRISHSTGDANVNQNKDDILSYSERTLYAGNLGGTHYFKHGKHKFQWNTGYTYSRQEVPDQRVIRLTELSQYNPALGDSALQWRARGRVPDPNGNGSNNLTVPLGIISRVWTLNSEAVYNGSLDYTFQYKPWLSFRAGTFQQYKIKNVFRRVYTINEGDFKDGAFSDYLTGPGGYGQYVDPAIARFYESQLSQVWSNEYLKDDGSGLKVFDRTSGADSYVGTEQNNSGYLAFSLTPLNRLFEVYGGLRVEYNRQRIAAALPASNYSAPTTGGINTPILIDNPTLSWLPSVNASLRPGTDWVLRSAYGRTVNRYEFREASPYQEIDYTTNTLIYGNPDLKTASVNNYDLRLEFYPDHNAKGESISIGAFYKDLKNPIERVNTSLRLSNSLNSLTFQNAESATIQGLELEMRKQLDFIPGNFFKKLSVSGNLSLIKSQAVKDSTTAGDSRSVTFRRPLQGQAPYIINGNLNYDNPAWGTRISASFNRVGTNIYAASGGYVKSPFLSGPLYRGSLLELPRNSLDVAITQRIIKSLQAKFSIQNLLNQEVKMAEDYNFSWKYEPGSDNISSRYNPGRYFLLNISYSL